MGAVLRQDRAGLLGFPFFFWYQFLWVFLCSGLTYTAYRLTLAAARAGESIAGPGPDGSAAGGWGTTDGSRTTGGDR